MSGLARERWKSSLVKLSILFNINASFFGIFRQGLLLLAVLIDEAVVGNRLVSIVSYIQLVIHVPRIYFGEILSCSYLGSGACWVLCGVEIGPNLYKQIAGINNWWINFR
jgi:hypothetical protein